MNLISKFIQTLFQKKDLSRLDKAMQQEIARQLFRKLLSRDLDGAGAQWIYSLIDRGEGLGNIIETIVSSDEFRIKFLLLPEEINSQPNNYDADSSQLNNVKFHFGVQIFGGIGDLIVSARFIRDFVALCEGVSFDVYYSSPASASYVFKHITGFSEALPMEQTKDARCQNTIFFRFAGVLLVEKNGQLVTSEDLSKEVMPNAAKKIITNLRCNTTPLLNIWRNHPFFDNAVARYAYYKGYDRRNFIHSLAGLDYVSDRIQLVQDGQALARLGLPEKFMTVHNGFDAIASAGAQRATKSFPYWNKVINKIRALGSDLPIVQLGSPETSEKIDNVDVSLIGKTDLPTAFSVIAHSRLHLDGEGGFVHAAAAMGSRSCVIFGPTDHQFYSYPNNFNFVPNQCGGCWWIEPDWMYRCPRGMKEPICMETHDLDAIAGTIFREIHHFAESN